MKPSREQAHQRRLEVFRRKLRGESHASIAKELSVNRKTVVADAAWLKDQTRELAVQVDRFEELGQAMAFFDEAVSQAMGLYFSALDAKTKNSLLLTAMAASDKKVRMMLDAGLIERAPVEINISAQELREMPMKDLLRRRDEMLHRLKDIGADETE